MASCCCENRSDNNKEIKIEYLYLDLQTCDRCIGTDKVLEKVLEKVIPTLELAGYSVKYEKIEIKTEQLAEQYRFVSSPTIRVNGRDICDTVKESNCGCCGEISGTAVDCRVFEYEGQSYEVPPEEMIAESILKGIFAPPSDCDCDSYELPENLKIFFQGKESKMKTLAMTAVKRKKEGHKVKLFGFKRKKKEEKGCCCGGSCCTTETMAQAENTKKEGDSIKVLGSGCAKCNELEAATKEALAELGMDTNVDHVTDFAQIAAYGVMSTPALVVDGKVVSYGKVLKKDEVIKLIQKVRG